jgi:hypothetical protein
MTVEITSRDTLETTMVRGDLIEVVHNMNLAAATGKQFVVCEDVSGGAVALETRNITRMREIAEDDNSFLS